MQRGAVVALRLWRTVDQQLGVDQRPGVDHHLRLLQQTVAFESNQFAIARTGADEPHAMGIKSLSHGFLPSDRR